MIADTAYQRIKEAIVSLRYRPGQKISEARLVTDLAVGRSPVRTALARLNAEGWVQILPQSGTFVRELTPDDVAELAELRLLLEPHATRVAAARIDDAELRRFRAMFDDLARKGVEGRFQEFLELDDVFHSGIHVVAGNRRVAEILRNLRDQIHWVRVSTASRPGRVDQSLREMRAVLDALERRDAAAAEAAMREHIANIAHSFASLARSSRPAKAGTPAPRSAHARPRRRQAAGRRRSTSARGGGVR